MAACELKLSKYREREGVFTRLSVVLKAKQMAPAAWWSQYGKHLRPAPPSSRAHREQGACAARPRLRASAAERNWSIYGKIKPKVSPRSDRSSGATPRPTSLEARLLLDKAQDAGYKAPVWRSGTPTPTRTRAMTRRGSWCRGEAVEAGRLAVSAGGAQDGKRCGGRQGAAS